ncbi:MAG: 3-oxoacyl-ACP synthase, partial [Deltaproteobacteria bacterium]
MPEILRATIQGTGSALPPRCVTNEELAPMLGVTAPWIRVRTGVEQRYYTEEGVYTSDLALEASRKALEDAGIEAGDLDLIIFGTLSP